MDSRDTAYGDARETGDASRPPLHAVRYPDGIAQSTEARDGVDAALTLVRSFRTDGGLIDDLQLARFYTSLNDAGACGTSTELLDYVTRSLRIDGTTISIRPIPAGMTKGRSGASLFFVEALDRPFAVLKIFTDLREVLGEVSAGEALTTLSNPRFHVPEILSLGRATINGSAAGVLLMSCVPGVPFDDLLLRRRDLFSEGKRRLVRAVGAAAKALANLHQAGAHGTRLPTAAYLSQELAWFDERGMRPFRSASCAPSIGFTNEKYAEWITSIKQDFIDDPGRVSYVHGDAGVGNLFFGENDGISFIDLDSMHRSLDEYGRPNGCAARDVVNFPLKLIAYGLEFGLDLRELLTLQELFCDEYLSAGGVPWTGSAGRFYAARIYVTKVIKSPGQTAFIELLARATRGRDPETVLPLRID